MYAIISLRNNYWTDKYNEFFPGGGGDVTTALGKSIMAKADNTKLGMIFFNNKANLLTKSVTRCHKILCTGNRMTGAENAGLVLSASFGVSLLLFLITPAKTR